MRVIFRCDASISIGSGHVIRCRTLARLLSNYGHEIIFICRSQEGDLINLLREEFLVIDLQSCDSKISFNPASISSRSQYQSWLGCSQLDDVRQAIDRLSQHHLDACDLLVIDHYSLDHEWEYEFISSIRPFSLSSVFILVIDDLADRTHICDFILDQNYFGALMSRRYTKLVPPSANNFRPEYALLSPEYLSMRRWSLFVLIYQEYDLLWRI